MLKPTGAPPSSRPSASSNTGLWTSYAPTRRGGRGRRSGRARAEFGGTAGGSRLEPVLRDGKRRACRPQELGGRRRPTPPREPARGAASLDRPAGGSQPAERQRGTARHRSSSRRSARGAPPRMRPRAEEREVVEDEALRTGRRRGASGGRPAALRVEDGDAEPASDLGHDVTVSRCRFRAAPGQCGREQVTDTASRGPAGRYRRRARRGRSGGTATLRGAGRAGRNA
jgi:hypothetical protein